MDKPVAQPEAAPAQVAAETKKVMLDAVDKWEAAHPSFTVYTIAEPTPSSAPQIPDDIKTLDEARVFFTGYAVGSELVIRDLEAALAAAPQIPAIQLKRSELAARLDDARVFLWEKGELKKGNEIAHVQASIIRMEAALAAERERTQRVTEAIEEGK